MISADSADTMMITCSACDVPIHGIRMKLVTSDPRIAPTVFAAYTPPASRAASCSGADADASASGKLAPHSIAPGSTTQKQRTRSSCSVNQGVVAMYGLIGQYGSDSVSSYAAHAIAPQSSSWHQPSARLGDARSRASVEPAVLPTPRPTRKTARISANVYTVAPKWSDSRRVHTTSAESAVKPDSAIVV